MQRLKALALALALASVPVQEAAADHPQSSPDPVVMKDLYKPEGHFKAGSRIPAPNDFSVFEDEMEGLRFNPSGEYNAFDTNVFETLALPYRAAGDESADDPYGNGGDPRHGYCAPDPDDDRPGDLTPVAGHCPNHQLEYSRYFEATMRDILADFGVAIRRYRFWNPGGGNTESGRAINTAAVVPGADHPEDTVIVSGHYDQTNEGPASVWDSAEGHAEVIRMAKIMSDYWRRTGTRPSATIKFVPWDAEESGTLGSADYVANNIVPGEELKVRGYWNVDPCAGGYPAYRFGNPADRVDLGIQIAKLADAPIDPENENDPVKLRIEAFNERAPQLVEEVFEYLDDELQVAPGVKRPIFVAPSEATDLAPSDIGNDVLIGDSKPFLFSSDWANFIAVGVPFFNPGPEITGPSDEFPDDGPSGAGNPDALAILHTPNDNHVTLNKYTSADPSGQFFSEGWMKGMEMCAHLLSWGMLQPDQAGAQPIDGGVVAYYEALPNEVESGQAVSFDAAGTYQYIAGSRTFVPASRLQYRWDFGDGSKPAKGPVARHTYSQPGRYVSRLTVFGRDDRSDTMTVPITVVKPDDPGPMLNAPPAEDEDGSFQLSYAFATTKEGLQRFIVEEAKDLELVLSDGADGAIADKWAMTKRGTTMQHWQRSDGAPAPLGNRRRSGAASYWAGQLDSRQVSTGEAVMMLKQPVTVPDKPEVALSYWSLFRNEPDETGIVEVAVDDGDPATAPEWKQVDSVSREFLQVNEFADGLDEGFQARAADLSEFRGKQVLVRFRYLMGGFIYFVSEPNSGWYIDDIKLLGGSFAPIGSTPADTTTFDVTGRQAGNYAYRVRAGFDDGLTTLGGNVEAVEVTVGAPPPPDGGKKGPKG